MDERTIWYEAVEALADWHDTDLADTTADIIRALGLDPDMPVATLRELLDIGQRAKRCEPIGNDLGVQVMPKSLGLARWITSPEELLAFLLSGVPESEHTT